MTQLSQPISEIEIQQRCTEALDALEAWIPTQDNEMNVDALLDEYKDWTQGEGFSAWGFSIEEIEQEVLEDVRIPDGFGYEPGGTAVVLHFVPPYAEVYENDGKKYVELTESTEPKADQKYATLAAGLSGALHYITLVEADLLPKPDYLLGFTNPTMARFSQRVGLKTAESIVNELSKTEEKPIEKLPVEQLDQELEEHVGELRNGTLDPQESKELALKLLRISATAKKSGNREAQKGALLWANAFMMNTIDEGVLMVWGRYEDFRNGVLKLQHKFGEKIMQLAMAELEAIYEGSESR